MNKEDLYIVLGNLNEFGIIGSYQECLEIYNVLSSQYEIVYLCKIEQISGTLTKDVNNI